MNEHEPQPSRPPILAAPSHLGEGARAVWNELIPELHACGLLTALDFVKLEVLVIHVAHHRRLYGIFNALLEQAEQREPGSPATDTSKLTRSLRQEADVIKSLSAGFGLDPSDRVRLQVLPRENADDPFAEFDDTPLARFISKSQVP